MKILATIIETPNAQNASFVNPYFNNNSKMSNAHSEPNVKSFFKYFFEETDTHSSSNVNTFSEKILKRHIVKLITLLEAYSLKNTAMRLTKQLK